MEDRVNIALIEPNVFERSWIRAEIIGLLSDHQIFKFSCVGDFLLSHISQDVNILIIEYELSLFDVASTTGEKFLSLSRNIYDLSSWNFLRIGDELIRYLVRQREKCVIVIHTDIEKSLITRSMLQYPNVKYCRKSKGVGDLVQCIRELM